jgi:hypothetical protein
VILEETMRTSRVVLVVSAGLIIAASWGAYFAGQAVGWWSAEAGPRGENLFIRDRDGLRACVSRADGRAASSAELSGSLDRLANDSTFSATYASVPRTVASMCPGRANAFRRSAQDGGYADTTIVDEHSAFSLHVVIGDLDGKARRGFEFVPLELECAADVCEAVTWALFIPEPVYRSAAELDEALRWVFQLPGKWTAEAAAAQAAHGRAPQPSVEIPPDYPDALTPIAGFPHLRAGRSRTPRRRR